MSCLMERLSPFSRDRGLSSSCALLVVDMQRFFIDPESHAFLPDSLCVLNNVRLLLEAFRRRGLPVIFTRHAHGPGQLGAMGRWWRDPLMDGSEMSEIALDLIVGEHVVVKERYDAFHGTHLHELLLELDVHEVVVAGVMTDLCVETTARSAFVRDLDVTVAADACCTQDPELHYASLLTLAHGFAVIKRTRDIIGEVSK